MRRNLIVLASVFGIMVIVLSLGIARSFMLPLRSAMAFSERIAAGDLSTNVRTSRRDEFGRLLVSLGKMQDALRAQAAAQRSGAEAKERDHATQVARRQQMEKQIAHFRDAVGDMLHTMTERMHSTAQTLSSIAKQANGKAIVAVGAAEQTSSSVMTVAAAAEELGTSVQMIMGEIERATIVVGEAGDIAPGCKPDHFRARRDHQANRQCREPHSDNRGADKLAGVECHDRGSEGRQRRQRLCRGCVRSEGACHADREGDRRHKRADRRRSSVDESSRRQDQVH